MKILNADQMRKIDRVTIEEVGIPGIALMENAAIGILKVLKEEVEDLGKERIGIIVGPGNNGGDGLALARLLYLDGCDVRVYLLADKNKISGDAKTNLDSASQIGVPISEFPDYKTFSKAKNDLLSETVLIDSLLGTGLSRPVTDYYLKAIKFLNEADIPILSIDIPSGLPSDTHITDYPHIIADITVALGNPKIPHILPPTAIACGEIFVADIGIPESVIDEHGGNIYLITDKDMEEILPKRPMNSHKGDYGHILGICGSVGKGGAAALAAMAALRTGAGLITLALPSSLNSSFEVGLPEVITIPLSETEEGSVSEAAYETILKSAAKKSCAMVGPGLTTNEETSRLILKLIPILDIPMLIDADGLNILAGNMGILKKRKKATILTPHPGEMARLCKVEIRDIEGDPIGYTTKISTDYNVYTVLKGARTIIASPEGAIFINKTGNPGMATAGTGDVLSGIITGLLSQGLPPLEAAKLGVYLHGLAGDIGAEELGEYSLIASDLIEYLPEAIRSVVED